MTQVFQIYSRLEAPLEDVKTAIEEDIDLPDGIEELELNQVNGKLQIQSVASDDSIGKYTPTAVVKGSVSEDIVVVKDDGTVTHQSVSQYQQGSGWEAMREDDDPLDTTTLKYINFYGRGDEVLVHDVLRSEMFEVLCQLTTVGTSGYVEGIRLEDDELSPVYYEAGGEKVEAEINIDRGNTATEEQESESPMEWTQHN